MGERAASTRRVTLLPMRVSELGGGSTAGDHVRVADAQAFIVSTNGDGINANDSQVTMPGGAQNLPHGRG